MRVLKARVAYDGTGYLGFQRQAGGPTIQAALERAARAVTGEPDLRVVGAGRTDAGVHALGQVFSVRTRSAIPAQRWAAALNAHLPDEVRVWGAEEAPAGFHPRYGARGKVYRYTWFAGPVAPPVLARYAVPLPSRADPEAMAAASAALVGTHDFRAFQDAGSAVKDTRRTLYWVEWRRGRAAVAAPFAGAEAVVARHGSAGPEGGAAVPEGGAAVESGVTREAGPGVDLVAPPPGEVWQLTLAGEGFLRHMVRVIAGTLVEVGSGRMAPEEVAAVLAAGDRNRAGPTAPARGLCLLCVWY